ncbi:MAG: peptidoglycan DD-metalloendopeptidase family protein [Bdellovibrionota bacterium]
MGDVSRKIKLSAASGVLQSVVLTVFLSAPCFAAITSTSDAGSLELSRVRGQINLLENELLNSGESKTSAEVQLKKIRRLLGLQQKEIKYSQSRIKDLTQRMDDLSGQKKGLLEKIEIYKVGLRRRLIELGKLAEKDPLDARWLRNLDVQTQKSYYLAKTLKKDFARVEQLRKNVREALALELKIIEEKSKLDYYVEELQGQAATLSANEDVQSEILRTNRTNRLDVMRRLKFLKESEQELERMIVNFKQEEKKSESEALAENSVGVTFAGLKGKLPFPVDGQILSSFGKSYNSKTNLLTFQKGITIGALPGTDVRAISGGKVVFAGPLKNYGRIVILEHPGKYYTLYGQLGSLAREQGAWIAQGEIVGKSTGEPVYFEIRDKNVAINPLQWLLNGSITLTKQ